MPTKPRILFVDDERHVLKGLRRSMLDLDDQWEMAFCESGAAALDELARQPADVVVSDMRMPQMDGAQLLDAVRVRYPGTIRVILSGYADAASVLKTVGPAHVYLAKPCDPKVLSDAISRPLALRKLLADPHLQAAIGEISNLPSPPDLFVKITAELRSPNASAASVAAVLAQDVAMTAEVLKLTNSAFFGLGAHLTTPLQAVRTLGLETIQTLVLKVGLFRQFDGSACAAPMVAALNDYSLALGRLAGLIAAAAGDDAETVTAAQCAGMLSSIGCLVFLDRHPEHCRETMERAGAGITLADAERAAYGATHNLVGAYLLGLWGFSDDVVEAVAFASEPGLAPGGPHPVLTAVHAATALGQHFPLLPDGHGNAVKLDMAYLIEARQDGQVRQWKALADEMISGRRHG